MVKKQLTNIISMTESVLGMKSGTITWSIIGKKLENEPFICAQFSYKGKEFVNIMAPVESEYQDTVDMVNDIMNVEERVVERIIVVLSSYGLMSLVQNVAEKGMKFMYVANPDYKEEDENPISFANLCQN